MQIKQVDANGGVLQVEVGVVLDRAGMDETYWFSNFCRICGWNMRSENQNWVKARIRLGPACMVHIVIYCHSCNCYFELCRYSLYGYILLDDLSPMESAFTLFSKNKKQSMQFLGCWFIAIRLRELPGSKLVLMDMTTFFSSPISGVPSHHYLRRDRLRERTISLMKLWLRCWQLPLKCCWYNKVIIICSLKKNPKSRSICQFSTLGQLN